MFLEGVFVGEVGRVAVLAAQVTHCGQGDLLKLETVLDKSSQREDIYTLVFVRG